MESYSLRYSDSGWFDPRYEEATGVREFASDEELWETVQEANSDEEQP